MGFFKKRQQKINSLWYPVAVTVGKPVTTDEVADRLAQISTVSRADTYAVLKDLGSVLGDYMGQGRTVKLDGVGTFYYTINAAKQGVATADEVTAQLIKGVRVRFIPETGRDSSGKVVTRSLVSSNVFWEEWTGKETEEDEEGGGGTEPGTEPGTGGGEDGEDEDLFG